MSAELTRVTYALKTLLVAGQCVQSAGAGAGARGGGQMAAPPNGLQLILSSAATTTASANATTSSGSGNGNTSLLRNEQLGSPIGGNYEAVKRADEDLILTPEIAEQV